MMHFECEMEDPLSFLRSVKCIVLDGLVVYIFHKQDKMLMYDLCNFEFCYAKLCSEGKI